MTVLVPTNSGIWRVLSQFMELCIFSWPAASSISLLPTMPPTLSIAYNGTLCISTPCITNTLTVLIITQYIPSCTSGALCSLLKSTTIQSQYRFPSALSPTRPLLTVPLRRIRAFSPSGHLLTGPLCPTSAGVGLVIGYQYLFPAHQNHAHYTLFTGNYPISSTGS